MPPKAYTKENVKDTIFNIINNGLSLNKAALKYNVLLFTFPGWLNGKYNSKGDLEA